MATIPAWVVTQITNEVGDPNGTIQSMLAAGNVWTEWAYKASIQVDLQYLYTKRSALDVRLAEEAPDTDFQGVRTLSVTRSQKFGHLQQMRVDCQAEIARVEARARGARVPVSGAITTTEIAKPTDPNAADANDPLFSGDPYSQGIHW